MIDIGYDPQMLLTDQRPPLKRLADELVENYRRAHPGFSPMHSLPLVPIHPSGFNPLAEIRRHTGIMTLAEARREAGLASSLEQATRFNAHARSGPASFGRYLERARRLDEIAYDAAVFTTVLDICIKPPWGDRIDSLLRSRDRRQRKRGRRLSDRWIAGL